MTNTQKYFLNKEGEFVIENYNNAQAFSSFLPAIAGVHGKPLWAYYVNRGQCLSAMGVNDKTHQIMEFYPANAAYRQTPLLGFRTFLKIKRSSNNSEVCYEPLQNFYSNKQYDLEQRMYITSYDIRLEEVNRSLGIKTEVMFCTLPGESVSSLIRKVSITNISNEELEIEMIDGLPVLIPYCSSEINYKNGGFSLQAFMNAYNYETIPYFKIDMVPLDQPEMFAVEGGYFYLNFDFKNKNIPNMSRLIVQPEIVFGNVTDNTYPQSFYEEGFSIPKKQVNQGKLPCGFGYRKILLGKNAADTSYSLVGYSDQYGSITNFVKNKLAEEYIYGKIEENRLTIESLKSPIFTSSSSREFDLYSGQTFLDNVLRGGYPVKLGKDRHILHVFSRKHGDMERDYNHFEVAATNYSQGNANYRDVNQNRRNDTCFFPYVEETNIKTFFNLLQLDGYNPLVLKGARFNIENAQAACEIINETTSSDCQAALYKFLERPYTPGSLLSFVEARDIKFMKGNAQDFLESILAISSKEDIAEHCEGFWIDHWTYNTDLLEAYAAIYPEKMMEILFNKPEYTFFDNYEMVVPRERKYVLTDSGVRQYGAVHKNQEKDELMRKRKNDPFKVRTENGRGEIYHCTLMAKIICLVLNKIATLDPEGVGIEMEANKPGWCDSLNALPGLLGSSVNEAVELKRLTGILLEIIEEHSIESGIKINIPEELYDFFCSIFTLLKESVDGFDYWKLASGAKEKYRERVTFGISGKEVTIDLETVTGLLKAVEFKIGKGLEKAFNSEIGLYYTYFANDVVEYEMVKTGEEEVVRGKEGYPFVRALKFKQRPVAYFLEGNARMLKIVDDREKAKGIYESVRRSELYDKDLGMYRINVPTTSEPFKLGRHDVFPRGTRENESIFLHLEYKYLFEILKSGLYDEFFTDFKKALIPFHDPYKYGRSILENSSFLNSTVHMDEKTHGKGFCPRLTGTSAEFLSMWLYMTAGEKPFYLDNMGMLCLSFKPILPGWMFTDEDKEITIIQDMKKETLLLAANTFAFNFLGKILTVYHNKERKDTFGANAASISQIVLSTENETTVIDGNKVPEPYSRQIRNNEVSRIDVYLV